MSTQNIYQDTFNQIKDTFQEEAASLLNEDQIQQLLLSEEARIRFAEQQHIPVRSWLGSNTRRYCKDLLRRQQPFFVLYYLLGICTEASIVLLFCYFIRALFPSLGSISFIGVPGAILVFYWCLEGNRNYTRRCMTKRKVPTIRHRILLILLPTLVISLISILFWQQLVPLYRQLSLYNTFLLYVALLFLSGIHNVLYSSHIITFFSVGAFQIMGHDPEKKQQVSNRYLQERAIALLATRKQTLEQMQADPELYADIHMEIRSQLVTKRIYLGIALFILTILDIICIYQYTQTGTVSILVFGLLALLCTLLLVIFILSCHELIRQTS